MLIPISFRPFLRSALQGHFSKKPFYYAKNIKKQSLEHTA